MSEVNPTITVAVPSYNKEKYIDRCLKSILANKDEITEIILVDNCSSDKTFELAKKYEPEIKCYRNDSNLGMGGNWNKCIDYCQTEWLMIFHADDEMLPGVMSKYLEYIKDFPSVGLIHADSYSVIEGDEENKTWNKNNQKNFWSAGLDALKCKYGVCSAVMVKNEVYKNLGYFLVDSLSTDVEMWARIAGKYDVGYINQPTVIYHTNPFSTGVNSLTDRSVKEIRADWDLLNRKIADSFPTEESRNEYLEKTFKLAPYSYWSVIKANIRARKFKNIFQAVMLVIFTYRGLWPLMKLSFGVIIKKIKT